MATKSLCSLLVCALLCSTTTLAFGQGVPSRPGSPASKKADLKAKKKDLSGGARQLKNPQLDSLKMSDLITGQYKNLSARAKLALIGNMPNRYGKLVPMQAPQAVGTAPNGVKYMMSRTKLTLPKTQNGATSVDRGANDLIVCESTPIDIAREFVGPLLVAGLPSSQNQSVIYPGALFKDSDVVRGVFTPLALPRTPGSITIDVFNLNNPVAADVANFNDRTNVTVAINELRSGAANANANAFLEYTEVEFKAGSQVNVELEASTEANLEALLGVPANVGASQSAAAGFEQGVNVAVASLNQVYYTISMGGEGPASTIDGSAPPDAVCITDVQYGRRAFLMVGSVISRAQASAVLSGLLAVSAGGTTLAEANRSLSADAKISLEAGFVRMTVVGGSVQSAVQVRDLATLRNYIEQIDPTVGGVGAVPIAYTLRYAADNAPAKVGAFAELIDKECFRASQVKVTLDSIKPLKVVDFGDEELFGSVTVANSLPKNSGERVLWFKGAAQTVDGKEGQPISVGESGVFNINAATSSGDEIVVTIDMKDRIMGLPDPEYAGASTRDRDRGFAQYGKKDAKVTLTEVRNAPNGKLTKKFTVDEGNAKLELSLTYELLGP
ncbi:MAG: thiol-activated cytolysin family protein [Phycisphaerae bacterium]|nr:thiol-activated cytolysin family protein [Phycisphaerae bacterium]